MKRSSLFLVFITVLMFCDSATLAQDEKIESNDNAIPIFENGEAQIVPGFNDPHKWIREDLWVVTEFDSDENGELDRMHVDVTRPYQTETNGLKLPVVYNSSPYFAGTASGNLKYFWNPRHELGAEIGRAHV